jgi:uncharacterized protein (TIGR02118 family)
MHRITIAYAAPSDPAAFDARYTDEHVPLVRRLPGLERFTLTRPRGLAGEAPYLVAELWFDSADDLRAALKSSEMAETGTHAQSLGATMSIWTGEVIDTLNP